MNDCKNCRHCHSSWCLRWDEPVGLIPLTDMKKVPFALAKDERKPRWFSKRCGPEGRYFERKAG